MKFKIYYEDIETKLPLSTIEKTIEDDMDDLKIEFNKLMENKKVLEIFNLQIENGSKEI